MTGDGGPSSVVEGVLSDGRPSPRRAVEDLRFAVWKRTETQLKPFLNRARHRIRYGRSAPRRYRLIHVDPTEVESLVSPHFWSRVSKYTTHVRGGNWDRRRSNERVMLYGRYEGIEEQRLIEFENYGFYVSARRHFEEGVPWSETELYEWLIEEWLPSNPDTYGNWYGTREAVESALTAFDDLYHHMAANGYLTQRELQDRDDPPSPSTPPRHVPDHHEVAVAIGRDGEIVFDDGRHRFVAAKLLGLDRIPVRVLVRHSEWQSLRSTVAESSSVEDLSASTRARLGHPDLQDVVPEDVRRG